MTEPLIDHEHDLRRNPFVVYTMGAGTQAHEVVCATSGCGLRLLRPIPSSPWTVASWPKADP